MKGFVILYRMYLLAYLISSMQLFHVINLKSHSFFIETCLSIFSVGMHIELFCFLYRYWSTLARDVPFAGLMVCLLQYQHVLNFVSLSGTWSFEPHLLEIVHLHLTMQCVCACNTSTFSYSWLFQEKSVCYYLFAQVTFYEALKDLADFGKRRLLPRSDLQVTNSFEGLILGGIAGGEDHTLACMDACVNSFL